MRDLPEIPPDQVVEVEIALSPRDARRVCNELATALEYFEEELAAAQGVITKPDGEAIAHARAMIASLTRIGEELDYVARAGGLAIVGGWREVNRG